MALVEHLGVGRWYVQLAAIWHWYLPLCIYITLKKNDIVSVHSFFVYFFNLSGIDKLDGKVDDTSVS